MKQCIKEANKQYFGAFVRWFDSLYLPSRDEMREMIHVVTPGLLIICGFILGLGAGASMANGWGYDTNTFTGWLLVMGGMAIGTAIGGYIGTICEICSRPQ